MAGDEGSATLSSGSLPNEKDATIDVDNYVPPEPATPRAPKDLGELRVPTKAFNINDDVSVLGMGGYEEKYLREREEAKRRQQQQVPPPKAKESPPKAKEIKLSDSMRSYRKTLPMQEWRASQQQGQKPEEILAQQQKLKQQEEAEEQRVSPPPTHPTRPPPPKPELIRSNTALSSNSAISAKDNTDQYSERGTSRGMGCCLVIVVVVAAVAAAVVFFMFQQQDSENLRGSLSGSNTTNVLSPTSSPTPEIPVAISPVQAEDISSPTSAPYDFAAEEEVILSSTSAPSTAPTLSTSAPSTAPTLSTSAPSTAPTLSTQSPSAAPTLSTPLPSTAPTLSTPSPSAAPTLSTSSPTTQPSSLPNPSPSTTSFQFTLIPTVFNPLIGNFVDELNPWASPSSEENNLF